MTWVVVGLLVAFLLGYGWATWFVGARAYRLGHERGGDEMIARLNW